MVEADNNYDRIEVHRFEEWFSPFTGYEDAKTISLRGGGYNKQFPFYLPYAGVVVGEARVLESERDGSAVLLTPTFHEVFQEQDRKLRMKQLGARLVRINFPCKIKHRFRNRYRNARGRNSYNWFFRSH